MKNNLQALRKQKRLSQVVVGRRLGIAHNSVSGYESGKTELGPDMIDKFAKALEVSADEIEVVDDRLREEGPAYRTENIPVALMPDFIVEQLEKYLAGRLPVLSGKDRAMAVDAVNCLGYERDRRAIEKAKGPK